VALPETVSGNQDTVTVFGPPVSVQVESIDEPPGAGSADTVGAQGTGLGLASLALKGELLPVPDPGANANAGTATTSATSTVITETNVRRWVDLKIPEVRFNFFSSRFFLDDPKAAVVS
jgi:hypothetical protein